jgi:hypothetical protein
MNLRTRISLAVAAWMALIAPAQAQNQPGTQDRLPSAAVLAVANNPHAQPATQVFTENHDDSCYRFWVRGEYLLWWTKGNHLPPLLTTAPLGTPLAGVGALGEPGTSILFGNSRIDDDLRSGGRFTAGLWLNDCQTSGIEANFFFLEQEGTHFRRASEGDPILTRPIFDVLNNQETSTGIAYPGVFRGLFEADSSTTLWGGEINYICNLCRTCCWRVDALIGYRYLNLEDDLSIRSVEINVDPTRGPVGLGFDITDSFDTRNQFHGGQVGARAEFTRGCWFLQVTGKLGLGNTERRARIRGNTVDVETGAVVSANSGLLALEGTNVGSYSDNQFSFVPEFGISVGYQITRNLRASVGYTFLYWTDVVRSGDTIDRGVNPSFLPPTAGVGDPRPAFNFRDSDFWAQGLNFGLELRF